MNFAVLEVSIAYNLMRITQTFHNFFSLLVAVRRNHIPLSTPGDKSYQSVEYSSDFFKHGATVPLVNFGYVVIFP